jgi:membrane associated rhomboid family serine protease
MIPIGDDNSQRRGAAWLTWLIILANIFVFVFIEDFGSNEAVVTGYAAVPAEILSGRDIVMGAQSFVEPWSGRVLHLPGLAPTAIPVFLTLFTAMFLHGGLGHIAGNMLFLGVFGDNVECRLGRLRYLVLYLASGLIGGLAHVAMSALTGEGLATPMIGASGAISGILGAYLALFPGNRVTVLMFGFLPTALSAWLVIGAWFIMQVFGGLSGWSSGGVAYLAHVGGFLTGWLWSRGYRRREAERLAREREARLRAGLEHYPRWWIAD